MKYLVVSACYIAYLIIFGITFNYQVSCDHFRSETTNELIEFTKECLVIQTNECYEGLNYWYKLKTEYVKKEGC